MENMPYLYDTLLYVLGQHAMGWIVAISKPWRV